jgi:transposase InsO family protein
MAKQAPNKTTMARELGVSRASLYYQHKRPKIDEEVKHQIESVMADHPAYGHKRIAIQLAMGHNRIRRIMKKYHLKPYRRRAKQVVKKKDQGKPDTGYSNLIGAICPIRAGVVWITDFTYIKYSGKFIYLATIIDLYTREVVGVNVSRYHNRYLVMGALNDALQHYEAADIIHSDQGSEYDSYDFITLTKTAGIQLSMSAKGSPWQNGHQESFFGHFKQESGDLSRFETVGELIEYIYQQIYYYNTRRIHSILKMSPAEFRKRHAV